MYKPTKVRKKSDSFNGAEHSIIVSQISQSKKSGNKNIRRLDRYMMDDDSSGCTSGDNLPIKEEPIEVIEFNAPTASEHNAVSDDMEFTINEKPSTKDELSAGTEGGKLSSTYEKLQSQRVSSSASVEADDRLFDCALCGFRTTNSNNLKYHTRTHSVVKPFECSECNFCTTSSSNLTKHLRVHTGEKPYGCDQCEHRFAQKDHLKRHVMRIHTGEKPFQCTTCKHRTADSSSLKKHMRVHGKIRAFQCPVCEYSSGDISTLKRHMSGHVKSEQFQCS